MPKSVTHAPRLAPKSPEWTEGSPSDKTSSSCSVNQYAFTVRGDSKIVMGLLSEASCTRGRVGGLSLLPRPFILVTLGHLIEVKQFSHAKPERIKDQDIPAVQALHSDTRLSSSDS